MGSQIAFYRQATAFETVGNVYAPYYRQVDAVYALNLTEEQRIHALDSIPIKDVTAAFDLGANIVLGNKIGLVINPINWKRDETAAAASESLGAFFSIDNQGNFGKVPDFADARINLEKGVLECSSVSDSAMFKLSGAMGLGVYHSFDISFYYYNLRENAERRAQRFIENN